MKISYGNNRFSKKWTNNDISWDDLLKRVKTPVRTTETVEEFVHKKKIEQDNIKDVGGFVGGHLSEGKRKKGMVLSRSMLTLDVDEAKMGAIEEVHSKVLFTHLIYTTHKHTKEHPRFRLIVPLSRDVSADEYEAIGRMLAFEIGIDMFDDTTYAAERLMYWPSCSKDGEFVFLERTTETLNPDDYLNKYDDWRDVTTYPTSSRQSEIIKRNVSNQIDPLTKDGVVGAFCRTYTIEDVLKLFLSDLYEESAIEGRYEYKKAQSSAGVVIYDNKFLYSHHASDPACGQLLNAFDLIRVHKFSHLDDKVINSRPITKYPSYIAMCEFALGDNRVKEELVKEKMSRAHDEFSDDDWMTKLELNQNGNIKDTLNNHILILTHDKNLQAIAYNTLNDRIDVLDDSLPWPRVKACWSDNDLASLKGYLSGKYGIYSPNKTKDAVTVVAAQRSFNPIIDYLEALPQWDGIKRVETLLVDYFGADDTSYVRAVTRKTLIAAIARVFTPGIKFDSLLILCGPQGIGKSTFFAKLAGEWFSDSLTLTDMKDKSGAEKLLGNWILELAELAGMKKAEVEVIKSFITRQDDKFRASYGYTVESHPRQCIIVGSTNTETGYITDNTGGRRYWNVTVSDKAKKKPWMLNKKEVEQIWAETLLMYQKGEKLYLEGDDAKAAFEEQRKVMEADEREGIVKIYLDTPLPDDWDSMSLFDRRNFLNGSDFGPSKRTGTKKRTLVCNMEIWAECFEKDPSAMKKIDSYSIASIMNKFPEWTRSGTKRVPLYGKQRVYERNEIEQEEQE